MDQTVLPPTDRRDAEASGVKSLRKALSVLGSVAASDRPLSVAEVALASGIARPTAHRLIQTLVTEGHLIEEGEGRFSIGFAVLPLAASLLDRNPLRVEALPHLHNLAQKTGERVNLGILHQDRVLYLAGIEKPSLPTIYTRFGKTVAAHCSSLGKAILAYQPEPAVTALLNAYPMESFTETTITSAAQFLQELEDVRRCGYALDRAEHVPGSYCVAVTVFDARNQPVGAISFSGRALDPLLAHVEMLRNTAEMISHLI